MSELIEKESSSSVILDFCDFEVVGGRDIRTDLNSKNTDSWNKSQDKNRDKQVVFLLQ
jgi:hypothetical protein